MNFKEYLALFLFLFLVIACQKDDLTIMEERIAGDWGWVSSSGGLLGLVLNPQTEGYQMQILFQKNGIYTKYRDSSAVDERNYWIEKSADESLYNLKIGSRDHLQINEQYKISFDNQNNLHLIEVCNDCMEHIYYLKE
jgi:hypothetical protein